MTPFIAVTSPLHSPRSFSSRHDGEKRSFADNVGPGANAEVTLPALAVAVVVLRIWLRKKSNIRIWWDDYTIVIAQVFMCAYYLTWWYACTFIVWKQHVSDLDADSRVSFLKASFSLLLTYSTANFTVKLSIVFLFWRAFSQAAGKAGRYMLFALFIINIGLYLNRIIGSINFCHPISDFWNAPQKCSPAINAWAVSTESIALAIELLLLVYPIPIIWNMRVASMRAKLTIYAAFTAGIMMVMCHATRITLLLVSQFTFSKALQDTQLPAHTFLSLLEHWLSTTSVCLPAMYSPLRTFVRQVSGRDGRRSDENVDPVTHCRILMPTVTGSKDKITISETSIELHAQSEV